MVIGRLVSDVPGKDSTAWEQIEAAQRNVRLPCLLIPQPAHAVLAGEIAARLLAFGDLPAEIVRAIQMHDAGWAASDAQQIQRLRADGGSKAAPISFIAIPTMEVVEAWTASINSVEALTKAGAVVVSRHFCLLALEDKAKQRFLQAEKARQQRLAAAAASADLERWTAALQFCDLLSLFLISGFCGPVAFPALPPISLRREGSKLRFAPETLRSGALSIQGLKHPVPAQGPRAETLAWEVEDV